MFHQEVDKHNQTSVRNPPIVGFLNTNFAKLLLFKTFNTKLSQKPRTHFTAIFIDLWPCSFTTKLS